jgi:formylmethanofuran dehydrogenase subunit A
MDLEKVVLKRYEKELKEAEKICKESSVNDFEFYTETYIDVRERIDQMSNYETSKDFNEVFKKYLALYTTNTLYENYLSHKKKE